MAMAHSLEDGIQSSSDSDSFKQERSKRNKNNSNKNLKLYVATLLGGRWIRGGSFDPRCPEKLKQDVMFKFIEFEANVVSVLYCHTRRGGRSFVLLWTRARARGGRR